MGKHLDELAGAELVHYAEADRRQQGCLEALRVSAVNELAYCPPSVLDQDALRTDSRSGLVPGVIEAALGWSRGRARRYDNAACLLTELFPATHTALAEGLVDLPAAQAIAEGLAVLDDFVDRERIEASTLDWLRAKGRRVTTGTVAAHVEEAVIKADPAAAKQRHKDRVRQRDIRVITNLDSVADLTVYDLPADIAINIYNQIDATAKTLKQHGDDRRIGHIRAEIAVSLLLGESRYVTPDDNTDQFGSTDDRGRTEDGGDIDAAAGTDAADGDSTDGAAPTTPTATPVTASNPATAASAKSSFPVRSKNILYVSLTALLGLQEWGKADPAVLGGFGPVIDDVAHRVLENNLNTPGAECAIVVTHPQTGKPLHLHPVDTRLFRGRRRDTVETRWRTCAWPTGCSRPAQMCIIDHSHDYALGGKTEEANGAPLCGPHDWEKSKNGWRQEREGHDLITWISPFGQRIPVTAPRTPNRNRRYRNRNRHPTPIRRMIRPHFDPHP